MDIICGQSQSCKLTHLLKVKEKLARIAESRKRTGGGEAEVEELDDIEELYAQVVNIELVDMSYLGLRDTSVHFCRHDSHFAPYS